MTSASQEYQKLNQNSDDTTDKVHPVLLEWKNLDYKVKLSNETLHVLKNISGFSNPGEILAVMGPSGSGKTSLLSILAQRNETQAENQYSGEVLFNNINCNNVNTEIYTRYLAQYGDLYHFLTVYETLLFYTKLRVDSSNQEAKKKVEKLVNQFRLDNVKNCIVGNEIQKGLSGGEKKRLSIALELVTNPSVLILDEPTSGLDSCLSQSLISILEDVKKQGVNIVFSIHQPSNAVFKKFDRLILMIEGRIVYQGKSSKSLKYFEKIGYQIDKDVNPPEFYMKLLRVTDRNNLTDEEKTVIETLSNAYEKEQDKILEDKAYLLESENGLVDTTYHPGFFTSFKQLLKKDWLSVKRSQNTVDFKLIQPIIISVLVDLMYWNLGTDNQGIEDRNGALFSFISINAMGPGQYYALITVIEKNKASKDIKDRLYPLSSYYASKFIIDFPFFMISALIFTLLIYFAVGFNLESWDKIFYFYLIGLTAQICAMSLGILFGSIADSVVAVYALVPAFSMTLIIFSGLIVNHESINGVFSGLKYISMYYYIKNAIQKNEFDDLDIDDDVDPKPEERFDYGDTSVMMNEVYIMIMSATFLLLGYLIAYIKLSRDKMKLRKNK